MTVSPFRQSLACALLGLSLGAQAAPAPPSAVSLDTTPRAGQQQRQQLDIRATMRMRVEAAPEASEAQRAQIAQAAERMAQMGALKMSMQMQQTLKVGQPGADGWLPLSLAVSKQRGQIEVGGKTTPMPAKNGDLAVTARFNPRDFAFEVQQIDGAPELAEQMRGQGNAMVAEALQLSKALSQRPLKVGDSIDVPLQLQLPIPVPGSSGAMTGRVHYKLVKLERGIAHFDLSTVLDIDMSAPAPAASAADAASAPATASQQPILVRIQGSGQGRSTLRLADRLPLSSQMQMSMQMHMTMPDNGLMQMDMDMDMRSRGENLAPTGKKQR